LGLGFGFRFLGHVTRTFR